MKKNMLIIRVVIACLLIAMPAFGVTPITSTDETKTVIGGASFVPSTSVVVSAAALPSTDATNPNTYAVTAVHGGSIAKEAGKGFGALSTSPGIEASQPLTNAQISDLAVSDSISLPALFTAGTTT